MKTLKVRVTHGLPESWYRDSKGVVFDVIDDGKSFHYWIIANTDHNYRVVPSLHSQNIPFQAIGFRKEDVTTHFDNNEQAVTLLRRDES